MELLERFTRGDREAFESLFEQFHAEVYGWVHRIVRDPAAAEDVLIEAFWRMWQARARFDPSREFGAWARRIATNAALTHLKAVPRTSQLEVDPPAPDSSIHDSAAEAAIRAAFDGLPPKLRVVATLAIVEEQPLADIAAALGISLSAAKSREFRAVRLLRRKLIRSGFHL
jgi:RNA polymerase sigma-70 factor, ECF subfamily